MLKFIKRPFIPIFLFFALGIFTGEKFNFSFISIYFICLICLSFIIVLYLKNKKSLYFPLMFFYCAGVLFITPHNSENFLKKAESYSLYVGNKKLKCIVYSIPEEKYQKHKMIVRVLEIDNKKDIYKKNILLKFTAYNQGLEFAPGNIIEFYGNIKAFENFKNPEAFDYAKFMRFKGIYGYTWASSNKVEIIGRRVNFDIFILRLRESVTDIINLQVKNKNTAAVLKAVTTGYRKSVDSSLQDIVSKAGGSHFLAISGLHIGMIFFICFTIFRFFLSYINFLLWNGWLRKICLLFGCLFAFLYALIAGFMPSSQRASILIFLGILGIFLNKKHDPFNILSACAFFIILFSPSSLFDIGFILSFTAVLFIITGYYCFPVINNVNKNAVEKALLYVKILFKTSLFAVAGTLPLGLYFFYIIPFYGIFISIIFIPVFSFMILPFAFIGIGLFYINNYLSEIFIRISAFGVSWFIDACKFVSKMPYSCTYAGISFFELLLIYFWIFYAVLLVKQKFFGTIAKIMTACLIFMSCLDLYYEYHKRFVPETAQMICFDVGKGNCSLIILPNGKTLMIDAGGFPGSDFDPGKFIIGPWLFKNKIRTIDYAVCTHGDIDHYKGFFYILDRFKVKNFYVNKSAKTTPYYLELKTIIQNKNIVKKPEKIVLKTGFIDFLQKTDLFDNENDNSLLIKVGIYNTSILFTGDLYKESQKYYTQKEFITDTGILMVPHHGSLSSLDLGFINKVSPFLAIISGGFRNHEKIQKRVSQVYESKGIEVYNINNSGAFHIRITRFGIKKFNRLK